MPHPAFLVPSRTILAEKTLQFRKQSASERAEAGLGFKDWMVVRASAQKADANAHTIGPFASEFPAVFARFLDEDGS